MIFSEIPSWLVSKCERKPLRDTVRKFTWGGDVQLKSEKDKAQMFRELADTICEAECENDQGSQWSEIKWSSSHPNLQNVTLQWVD